MTATFKYRKLAAALTAAFAMSGCVAEIGDDEPVVEEVVALNLDEAFAAAAAEFDVPEALLKSVGYAETGWQMVEGEEEFEGRGAAYGVMGLRGDDIARGAELAGVDPDDVRYEEVSNIRAAAALLDKYADELGLDRANLGAWAPAVAELSDIEDAEALSRYVITDVYGTMQSGAALEVEGGHTIATLKPTEVQPDFPESDVLYAGTSDYPAAVWRPSPNHSARPSGSIGKVGMVIIHTCEGGYSGCWGWLKNPAAGASAHYVVKENGSEITQLVRESRRAWHIAANYSCSNNSNKECWRNGYSSNHFTVGIEHAGYASQSSFPNGQIEASAKLTCNITKDHGIARDRYHIVGHGQLQPWNRTDPGKNWPWTHYINRVKAHCGDGGGGGGGGGGGAALIIDSNNGNNNQSQAKMVVSGSWAASNSSPGYYGTGYWWASTMAVSDAAEFQFYMPADGTRTIDAWWVAGANRAPSATFVAFNTNGAEVGRKTVNQQTNGKRWVTLGTWNFKKGWNKVVLSRWAAEGKVVVADAVRVR